ncbi:MAG: hypothetical protein IIB38_03440 [Candidatus Hydrogenedentes bacterium]|nr:hypothetical protein [Candidatus Hydrogenedentota bacterium]
MAKRQRIDQKEFNARWKDMPKSDQRFFSALSLLIQVIGDKKLRYCEPSASRRRSLRRLDRNALLSVIVECLHLLLDAPMLDRVKQGHRERGAKKKKRISAAKKRQSAPEKKSRAKEKPAPKRRKITKGRTK